jgi:K+-transporting ATPase ATPase C chain
MRLPVWISQHLAALRALLVLTVLTGIIYPLAITAIAQLPGLKNKADGSLVTAGETTVGSAIIGQGFIDSDDKALVQYFQARPSTAGGGWDPGASGASNLGPESTVDTLPVAKDDAPSSQR